MSANEKVMTADERRRVRLLNGLLQSQAVTNYVRPVMWVGQCPRCGEDSPEVRDSPRAAQADADDCPCRTEPN